MSEKEWEWECNFFWQEEWEWEWEWSLYEIEEWEWELHTIFKKEWEWEWELKNEEWPHVCVEITYIVSIIHSSMMVWDSTQIQVGYH